MIYMENDKEEEGLEEKFVKEKKKVDDAIDPAQENMLDGFFDLHGMEAFVDEEEEYLPNVAFREEKKDNKEDGKKYCSTNVNNAVII